MTRRVVITGAASGFGYLSADLFLKAGWEVIATLRNARERESLFAGLQAKPGQLHIRECDVTSAEDREQLAKFLGEKGLDALVNNAGFGLFGACEDISEEQIRHQMEVNFFGCFLLTQKLLPAIRQAKGSIITISSVLGLQALPMTGAYCASKFAVEGWMEALAGELQPHGVSCYLVEPGGYPTGFGSSIAWPSLRDDSPYKQTTELYKKLRVKISARSRSKDPLEVAAKILQLAERRPRSLRHPIGSDAKGLVLTSRLFSRNSYSQIMMNAFHRMLNKA